MISTHLIRPRKLPLLLAAALFCIAGCQIHGQPHPEFIGDFPSTRVSDDGIRQTDDNGVALPFLTQFPRRWNSGNNGTSYEPCTEANADALTSVGLLPRSARDAASADFQTARGCVWKFAQFDYATLSQTVGNSPGLDAYKAQYSASVRWRGETQISYRRVAIGGSPGGETCETFVSSGRAIVVASAYFAVNPPPIAEICDKAIAFTRATIDQMPE